MAIVSLLPLSRSLADIGTDHAFIPIYTIQSHLVTRAIATDLRVGPLDTARQNVATHRLQDTIDLRLGDGLSPLAVGEVDIILSAGIGGHVHSTMLLTNPEVAKSAKWLVFQPMNAGHVLRRTLDEGKYQIVAENLVEDDGRIYEIILARPGRDEDDEYTSYRHHSTWMDLAYTYGPKMLRTPPDLFDVRLEREVDKRQRVIQSVQQSDAPESIERQAELRREIEEIRLLQSNIKGRGR